MNRAASPPYRRTSYHFPRSPAVGFLIEIIVGSLLFVIIAIIATSLTLLVRYLETQGIYLPILYGVRGAEYALFFADLMLFARFLWRSSLKTWRAL
jgi:hypothetical protein